MGGGRHVLSSLKGWTLIFLFTTIQVVIRGDMPEFNMPEKPKKPRRAPRREMIGYTGRRATLPVRGSVSLRAEFHNVPVNLPPPPDASPSTMLASEHAYASSGPS